jgi:hypothetical protein
MTRSTSGAADPGRHPKPCAAAVPQKITHTLAARRVIAWLVGLGCWAAAVPGLAAGWSTFAVDDSMSQVQAGPAALRWRHVLPSKNTSNQLDANLDVRIVLDLKAWVGKPARIYMVMPPVPQSSLVVQWVTQGTLSDGRLSGGQRQLVFQGTVPAARLEDTLHVIASADARDPVTPPRVNFRFEIEVPTP